MRPALPVIAALRGLQVAASLLRAGLWLILSLPEALLTLAGMSREKTLRVLVVVQLDEASSPVASDEAVQAQLSWAADAFARGAHVRLIQTVIREAEPSAGPTLDVRGYGDGAVADLFGHAGAAFRAKLIRACRARLRRLSGYGSPVVVFAVREFRGGRMNGVSFGALDDHALVVFGCNPATLAHECGHSCMLLHRRDPGNLMHPSWPRGAALTRWQALVLRMSPHVTYR